MAYNTNIKMAAVALCMEYGATKTAEIMKTMTKPTPSVSAINNWKKGYSVLLTPTSPDTSKSRTRHTNLTPEKAEYCPMQKMNSKNRYYCNYAELDEQRDYFPQRC